MRIRSWRRGAAAAAAARAGSWLAEPAAREGERSGGRGGGGGGGGGAARRAARGERAARLIPGRPHRPERTQRGVGRSGPRLRETASLKSTTRPADFALPIPKSSLKGRSHSVPDISLPPESREPEPRARTYGTAGRWAPGHDAVGTGGLWGENEERCKLVPEKESKWRFWMCKVHQLRSHFPSSSSPTGREVGEELATPAPQPSSRPPPRPPAPLPRPHARRLALPLSP